MRTIIDGQRVELEYIFFDTTVDGRIVQIRIESNSGVGFPLHCVLRNQLPRMFDAVMDNQELDEDGFTEIRVLNASQLEVIDAIRFLGLGVAEVAPMSTT